MSLNPENQIDPDLIEANKCLICQKNVSPGEELCLNCEIMRQSMNIFTHWQVI